MDIAYDHIQEESLPAHHERDPSAAPAASTSTANTQDQQQQQSQQQAQAAPQTLNTEFQQAFQAVSSSPWGARLGGWFGEARKQGQTFYSELQKEASEAQQQASKGFEGLRGQLAQRTAGLNLNAEGAPLSSVPGEEAVPMARGGEDKGKSKVEEDPARPDNLAKDIVKEASSMVASFRLTATSKLKDLQRAEDAADEALLKFGTNVADFLKNSVIISAPTEADASKPRGTDAAGNEVLFETTDNGTGRKVFHTTRLDAQLHAVHTTASSFTQDPQGEQWIEWEKGFDIDKQTEAIAKDLDEFEDLRRAMEKLVPEKVEYRAFWVRYYFMRKAIDEEEKKRKEVLKDAAADNEEDVAWDDDDEDEEDTKTSTPQTTSHKASASTTTLTQPTANDSLKVKSPRRSTEDESKSVADSDTSYDIVSGATSRAPGSPKDEKKESSKEDSDDDWE